MSEVDDLRFRVAREPSSDSTRLVLHGELDVSSASVLDRFVHELRPITSPLVLDVSALAFVDSSGLRALTAVRRAALDDTGAPVALSGCGEMLTKLLAMTGLADAFVVVQS